MSITLQAHALNRIVQCNGSFHMGPSEVIDDGVPSDDCREGVAAHWAAMEVIDGRHADPIELVDRQAPNGVYITAEMAEFVDDFVQDVLGRKCDVYTEHDVSFNLSEGVNIACRLDLATFDHATQTLIVDDFKYGWRLVEPFENWQLVAGAMGWCIKHQIAAARIILNIHQPRPHHWNGKKRSWEFNGGYADFYANAYAKMQEALSEINRNLQTGPSCYQCSAQAHCPAFRAAKYSALEAMSAAFDDRLSNEELSNEIIQLERAQEIGKQLLTACKELMQHRINQGAIIPGWFMEPGFGKTRWKPGVKPEHIKLLTGIDVSKPDMITPKQAEKKGVSSLIISAFSERPPIPPKLVHKSADEIAGKMFKTPTKDN